MTNEEINKYIHGEIMGECVVKVNPDSAGRCSRCGKRAIKNHEPPDYCSDASPRSLLNEVVAKIVNTDANHSDALRDALDEQHLASGGGSYAGVATDGHDLALTAEQVARACVEADKGAKR